MNWNRSIRPRQRTVPGQMNKTEQAYAIQLEIMEAAGMVVRHRFAAIKLKLADKTYYSPDFYVVCPDHIELHEVKGFWEDDARVKIKVAAEMFPEFLFVAIKKVKGGWEREEF